MDNTEVINVLSFCTGYGGIELGLARVFKAPLRCVAVEIEAFAACNLVAKAEEGKLGIEAVYSDLKKFPAEKFRGCFDIITAGYPCQPFSHAGKRKGKADPRHLWPFIRDSIEQIDPILFVGENVAGHLSLGFDRVVSDLEDLNYTTTPGIYAAAETGAPHRRERLFFVAYRECDGLGWILRQAGCRQDRTKQRTDPDGQSARDGGNGPALAHSESGRCGQAGAGNSVAANRTAGTGSIMDNPLLRRYGAQEKEVCSGRNPAVDAGSMADSDLGQGGSADVTESRETKQPESGDDRRERAELATAERDGRRGRDNAKPARQRRPLQTSGSGQLADTDGSRTSPGRQDRGVGRESQSDTRWPARPGQPQHEWEQPRVILSAADHKILKSYVEKYQTSLTEGQVEAMAHAEALYAPEPEMGRIAYGFTARVDELRLLGNGVMPDQFEMALRDLLEQIEMELKTKNSKL